MTENKEIIAYKGFNEDWKCRDYQYEVGKTYEHEGEVKACESGFHACENPLDVLHYYEIANNSKYALVKASGEISKEDSGDTKIASSRLKIEVELNIHKLLKKGFEWVTNKAFSRRDELLKEAEKLCKSATSGDYSTSATSGDYSTSATSGYYSTSATSGDYSTSATSGYKSTSATSGDYSTSATSGDYSTSATSGYKSTAIVTGNNSVAIAFGANSKSKASTGSAIVCCYFDDNGDLIHIRASKVGENGIKPDTFYTLDENGEFVEAE